MFKCKQKPYGVYVSVIFNDIHNDSTNIFSSFLFRRENFLATDFLHVKIFLYNLSYRFFVSGIARILN